LLARNGVRPEEAERLLAVVPDPDQRLAEAMAASRSRPGETRLPLPKAGFVWVGDDPLGRIANYSAAVFDLPQLEAAAAGNGFLNQSVDWDQVVRRVPLILRLGEKGISVAGRRNVTRCPRRVHLCRSYGGRQRRAELR